MIFPNFSGKHAHDAFITPQDYVAYLRRQQLLPDRQMPHSLILCYQNRLLRQIVAQEETEHIEGVPSSQRMFAEPLMIIIGETFGGYGGENSLSRSPATSPPNAATPV